MNKLFSLLIALLVVQSSFAQDSTLVFSPKRLVKLEGGSNFRDLGGYPTAQNKHVKWGHIFRSADVSKLTDNDLKTLTDLHLATVCDLRGPDELKTNPDKLPAGVNYINLPAGSEKIQSASIGVPSMNRDSMMNAMYSRTDHLKAKYKPMFDQLLSLPTDKALMFHCTAGKDRTGMGAALVLAALGVDKKYIVADYEATNIFWKATREKMLKGMEKQGMPLAIVKPMLDANPAWINTFFASIDKQYGSMKNFLTTEMELSPAKLKALKKLYVE
jgi:protein-tyrosine phosphatase